MKIKLTLKLLSLGLLASVNIFAETGDLRLPPSSLKYETPSFTGTAGAYVAPINLGNISRFQNPLHQHPTSSISIFQGVNLGIGLGPQFKNQPTNGPSIFGNYDIPSIDLGFTSKLDFDDFKIQTTSVVPFEVNLSNPTSVFSCDINDHDLGQLEEATGWSSCYEDRRSYVREPNTSDSVLLARDQEICNCLRSSPVSEVRKIMDQAFITNHSNTRYFGDRLKQNMQNYWQQNPEELNNEYSNTMNSFYFQANVVSRGDPLFVGAMSYNMFGQDNSESKPPVFEPTSEGFRLNPSKADDPTLLRDAKYPPGQCVSPFEFLALRQLPVDRTDGPLIKAELSKPFDPSSKDWDYVHLESEYRALMALSIEQRSQQQQRDKILLLKAKLKYLNRNPMIKYIMGASPADVGLLQKNSTHDDEIRRLFTRDNNDLKNQMFSIMAKVKGDCDSACVQDYHSSLKGFFDDDEDRILLASLEAHKDSLRRMNRKVNVTDYNAKTVSTPKQRDIIAEFQANFGLRSPDECSPGRRLESNVAVGCLDIYSAYCRTLDKYETQILNESEVPEDIKDNLDQLMADDLETNIYENEEFREYNDAICNTPRSGFLKGKLTFFTFKDNVCEDNWIPQCDLKTPEDYAYFRTEFDKKREPDARDLGEHLGHYKIAQLLAGRQMTEEGVEALAALDQRSSDPFANIQKYVENTRIRSRSFGNQVQMADAGEVPVVANAQRNYVNASTNNINNVRNTDAAEESLFNYSNVTPGITPGTNTNQVVNTETPKIQDMDQERRQELLNDWEKEYNQWKENKGNNLSSADQSKDSQLRTEISTLKALLDQQKQISDQQFELLNDAIAARTRLEQENIAKAEERERSESNSGNRVTGSSGVAARSALESDISRGPASLSDQQFSTAGAVGGGSSAGSASLGGGGSISGNGSRASAIGPSGSSDSVAREEAKLVNFRQNSDGSIVIAATGAGVNTVANAISVPLSDENYQLLRTNPKQLNLSEIERSIPREQIAQLEKNGEIILLLQNGTNPPYEVKVRKQDNKLVYSTTPVRRIATLDALRNLTR